MLAACTAKPGDGQTAPLEGDAASPPPDVMLAEAVLSPSAGLPARPEVVALADRLAVASSRAGRSAEGAYLALLGARLRERLWRLDQRSLDAGEALELYGAVASAVAGSALSCEADRSRATLAGELARDARQSFRDLYLAQRRQRASDPGAKDASMPACLRSIDRALAALDAFRPTAEAWQQLEQEGDRAAEAQRKLASEPASSPGDGDAGPDAAASSSAPPAANLVSPGTGRIVVAPDQKQLGTGPVDLTKIQPFSWEQGGRIVLTLSAPATYELGTLGPDPTSGRGYRVYLDVARARARGVPLEIPATGLVHRVRLGKRPDGTRVVLDLAANAYQKVFYLPQPFRIVIDLGTRPPAQGGEAQGGGKRNVRRVTLDPGHGGDDDGAIGPTGLREKDVTLDVAHRAAPALAHELGIETMLTRDTDGHVYLEERTARANAFHADVFVSIHCNATDDGQARGVQLFVLDPSREMDALAQRVAGRENALGAARGRPYDPQILDAQVASIAAGLNVGDLTQRSNHLAELLRTATLSSMQQRYPAIPDHGIKTAGFFVLVGAEMPAVLYETSFISNPGDEALLATADYRQKLADAIANAIKAYRDGR
jgi:N-acetylmuramoyl-L-alanine amidase